MLKDLLDKKQCFKLVCGAGNEDAIEVGGISDTVKFSKFLGACAALVSQQVNYSNLAQAADISEPTAKEWLNVLQGLGVVYLLKPYENNELKRLTKTPKLYFCDDYFVNFEGHKKKL